MSHETVALIMGAIFVIGYIAIVLEHNLHINKSGSAIIMGVSLWMVVDWFEKGSREVGLALSHETQEIFGIVVFLLAAMTLVEILVHYNFFNWVQEKIMQKKISQAKLFWLLGALTFVFSAFLDNLTTTLIMIQIGRKIYRHKENFLIYVINTVIAANAGGAASPIGDVTTIMLWLANKFTAIQVISLGIVPALVTWVIPQYMLGKKIKAHEEAEKSHPEYDLKNPYWPVVIIGFLAFTLPVWANLIGLPPFLGLLAGIGILWIFIDIKAKGKDELHKNGQVINIIQKADLATLNFFIGILLAVGALAHMGILKELNHFLFGASPDIIRLAIGNVALGFISSVLDNVPLVAASIKMFPDGISYSIWVLLALTAGTGGSMLVVGSAAGVAAMGQVKELTFLHYFKNGTLPALIGYIGGITAWAGIYYFFMT